MIKNKIKILIRIRSMETGGVQKVLLNILNNLNKNKFEITLLLNLYQGELLEDIPKDINVCYIGKGKNFLSKFYLIRLIQLVFRRFKLIFYNIFPLLLYKKFRIENLDFEIAFLHYNFNEVLKSPIKNSKKIGWVHGDIRNTGFSDNYNIKIIEQINSFDKCIFVSNQTKNIIEDHYRIKVKYPQIIYNPIDVSSILLKSKESILDLDRLIYDKNNNIKTFISIGRLTVGKGYHILLDVHKDLISNGFFHKIYIVGEGNYKNKIEEFIDKYNLRNTFILLGGKHNPYPFIKQADFFVSPSFSEAYPLALAESLILEKPIIITDVGGVKEMMSNDNGIIVESRNKVELYDAMKLFLTDHLKVSDFASNNKKFKEYFNPTKIYSEIENLFIK
ncbi:glycosyltransferase [Apibacter muscae]|uniref:glycosyltransferase n=1 Tax=Apibacter muscae TaxID=2509004 RepID=UPI0011ADA918|nr:glycosyltransferase [Apibacter muscae]TWP24887.1 glycosyltransferase [Apibacter muscae]